MEKNSQKKTRKCSTCGDFGHNNRTCQGGPVGSNPKKKSVRKECLVDGDTVVQRTVTPKKTRKKYASTTASSSKSTPVGVSKEKTSSGTAAPSSSSVAVGASKKKTSTTSAPSSSSLAVGASKKKTSTTSAPSSSSLSPAAKRNVTGTAPSTSSASASSFHQIYNGTVNIRNQNNVIEPDKKRQRKPNSKYM
ncbi:hypothetical protein MKX01_000365 [Papaver californicum]|nr:hypothetical protein MKX01_000365 [Papaver californicum]